MLKCLKMSFEEIFILFILVNIVLYDTLHFLFKLFLLFEQSSFIFLRSFFYLTKLLLHLFRLIQVLDFFEGNCVFDRIF